MAVFYALCAQAAAELILKYQFPSTALLGQAVLLALVRFVLQLLSAALNARLVEKCEIIARSELLQAIYQQGPFAACVSPALAPAAAEITEALTPYFASYRRTMRQVMILPCVLLVFIYEASPLSALMLLILCPLIPLFMVLIGKKAKELNDRQLQQIHRLSNRFFEALAQLPFIFVFDLGRKESAAVRRMNRRWRVETMQILYVAFLSALALEFFATVGVAFCAVTLGFAVLERGFSYQDALFVLLCAPEFFIPLRKLGASYHAKQRALAAADSLQQLFNLPDPQTAAAAQAVPAVSPKEASKAEPAPDAGMGNGESKRSVKLLPGFPQRIVFNQVTAYYPDGRAGLKDQSFSIEAGKVTVLTGPSGSGKSTVLNLLAGLLTPAAGSISLEYADAEHVSVDLSGLSRRDYAQLISFVPQRPYLFYGTIRSNLLQVKPEASEDELLTAIEQAGAGTLLKSLPQGLDTPVGDDHAGLSGGQMRLLALARALLKESPLLLLDEPSASLDPQSEEALITALRRIARSGSRPFMVIAAHRPQLIALGDAEVSLGGA